MMREDINDIINAICPNDEDFEKACISPAYLKKELEALALEQRPSGDTISKASVFEILGNLMSIPYDFDRPITEKDVSESIDKIRALPPVTPTRKKGKWIVEDSGNYNGKYSTCYCSNCKDYYTRAWREMKYCPNCGAKMESEE